MRDNNAFYSVVWRFEIMAALEQHVKLLQKNLESYLYFIYSVGVLEITFLINIVIIKEVTNETSYIP